MKSLCYVFVDCLILRGRLIIHMGYGTEKILLKYCAYQYQNWLPTEQLPVTLLCVTLLARTAARDTRGRAALTAARHKGGPGCYSGKNWQKYDKMGGISPLNFSHFHVCRTK